MTDINELQIRLVDERGRLECVAVAFVPHVAPGDAAQLRVDHRHELLKLSCIPVSPGNQEVRDVSA